MNSTIQINNKMNQINSLRVIFPRFLNILQAHLSLIQQVSMKTNKSNSSEQRDSIILVALFVGLKMYFSAIYLKKKNNSCSNN